ncbi:MAG TPA: SDR family NAD(P)-dependent oxidoreductase [bacterium]|mgnify:CR=1 FL=1|nr:SDR family NAD(P)-dependent oxidoreductase [bacterium]HPT29687.1 SDR family NAD(P)-dependent oxidoreductase [bacterium]
MRLAGKIAIVTGASAGLGKAMAEMFLAEGAKVVFSDINPYPGTLVENSRYFKADTSKSEEVKALVDYAVEQFGSLDIMVNNAGVGLTGELSSLSDETWNKVLSINLNGVFYGLRSASAYMKEKKIKGSIINIASILGQVGFQSAGAYCASKGGVNQLTRTAALELAKDGIRVNSIAPGFIKTAMTKGIQDNAAANAGLMATIPLGHMGDPEDIALAAVYLASDESKYATGSVLYVDGGFMAQ